MSTEPSASPKPRPRRWRRRLLIAVALLFVAVAAAPYLLSWQPFRKLALTVVPTRLHARIDIDQVQLGWFSTPRLRKLEVQTDAGEPLIEVQEVEFNQSLWQLASHAWDLGQIEARRATLRLQLKRGGSNLEDVLGRPLAIGKESEPPPVKRPPAPIRRKLDLKLVDASVVWRTPQAKQDWSVDKLNLNIGLRPPWAGESGSSEFLIWPGKVVDHCQLSPGLCDDVLKYAAPILSKVTRAEGELSIELDAWRIPLEHPEQGELGGRMVLHNVQVGPGNIVHLLAEVLHLPMNIALARESVVEFELIDGRIHHRDLAFELPGAKVRTSGSVGFDRTLDLLAEVRLQLPERLTAKSELARSLSERTLRIPIRGTLSKPRLEAGFVRELGLAGLFEKLEGLGIRLPGGSPASGAPVTAGEAAGADESDGKLLTDEAAALIEDLLRKWPERRRARREAADAASVPAATDDERGPQADAPPAKRRALDRLRGRFRRSNDAAEP